MITVRELRVGKGLVAREILGSLPEWFGIPEAVDSYVEAVESLPVLAAFTGDEAIGFLALKEQTTAAWEALVLGVKRQWHRTGCGRALFEAAEQRLAERGVPFLTVKTLAASHPDENYRKTRRFYEAIGFAPVEVLPSLWDPRTPCLLMIKPIELVNGVAPGSRGVVGSDG
jgi:GNAT superfamily N-acetyltransferase